MHGYQLLPIFVAASLSVVSAAPAAVITDNSLDGACRVQNRLVEYNMNGYVSTINIPECVVSTAYVIRSTVTTDPEDVARFIEVNHGCCCEVAQFTRRQIRIGHTLHKYNEIESCACRSCDLMVQAGSSPIEVD